MTDAIQRTQSTLNVKFLGFSIAKTQCDQVPDMPDWVQKNAIMSSITNIGKQLVDIEHHEMVNPAPQVQVQQQIQEHVDNTQSQQFEFEKELVYDKENIHEDSTESGGSLETCDSLEGKCHKHGPKIAIEMESNVLNFGSFTSGKQLWQNIKVINDSDVDQLISIKFGQQKQFPSELLYECEELPFEYIGEEPMQNSAKQSKYWCLLDPKSKENQLEKKISFTLKAGGSENIAVSLKTPANKLHYKMAAQIQIKSIDFTNSKNQKNQSLEQDCSFEERVEVMAVGYLNNPQIKCMKQLFNKPSKSKFISLAVKKTDAIQKFQLPFKNMSDDQIANLEFSFINVHTNEETPKKTGFFFFEPATKLEPLDCITFSFKKQKVKLQPGETRTLSIFIEVDTMKLLNPKRVDQSSLQKPLSKLLVARIKNSKILFSYFLAINLVEGESFDDSE